VDGLDFINPVRVGDLIILKARVTATFKTSLEVEVLVYSEQVLTGNSRLTSRAHLTFVTVEQNGVRSRVPPLLVETDEERKIEEAARTRHAAHLARRDARR
jgi:acyl-CoA hydrolase